jgi:hypothetical protein
MMKMSLLTILMVLVLSSGVVFAQSDSAEALVTVRVLPNIATGGPTAPVILNALNAPGPFSGEIPFRVDANRQLVDLSVQVSNLYKDGDPGATSVILVNTTAGVLVNVPGAIRQPIGSPNTALALSTTPIPVGAFQGFGSAAGTWGSGDPGHFSLNVLVDPSWTLAVETAEGNYGGTVILTAAIVP